MNKFVLKDKVYSYVWFKDLKYSDLPKAKAYKKSKYLDLGCGFDIETTNFQENDVWYATMYVWQFSLDDLTILGRTWDEFAELISLINDIYSLDAKKRRLLCFIHNMNFEFSFLRKWIPVEKIVAKSKREVLTFSSGGIEFRDSAVITHFSLKTMSEKYNLGLEKLKGDLDYKLVRISDPESGYATDLMEEEIAYCINDVQILQRFFHKYIKQTFMRNGYKIPLTQTSIPRSAIKRELKKMGFDYIRKYRDFIKRCQPDEELYLNMRRYLFRGGFVHANNLVVNETFSEQSDIQFAGFDRKSSYIASILQKKHHTYYTEQFPYWFDDHKNESMEFFENTGFVGMFAFTNIHAKYPHSIESKHKLINYENATFDNGRLLAADYISVMLTEYDWMNYNDFYDFDEVICVWILTTEKDYLPEFLIKTVYQYYYNKETSPKGEFYDRQKEQLNGIFGCMVTGLVTSDYIIYNGEILPTDDPSLPEDIRKDPKTYQDAIKNLILLPQWGILVSAISRYELLRLFQIAPYDSLYGDTDSDKIRDFHLYEDQIATYNKHMEELNKQAADRWNLDFEIIKNLGKFMKEDEYLRFKTLGAKRYLYETKAIPEKRIPSKIKSVVAGMEKGSFLEYCKEKELDPFDAFNDNLYLEPRFANKITSNYVDQEFSFKLTDYTGHSGSIYEKSCCALFSIPFSMKIEKDFMDLILALKIKDDRKREVYKDVL